MNYSQKAQELLSNQKILENFSAYAKYLPQFYEEIARICPECADEVIERFDNIKIHIKPKVTEKVQNASGATIRYPVGDKINSQIKLESLDAISKELDDFKHKKTFFHEMLHAIASVQEILPDGKIIPTENRVFLFGLASVDVYPPDFQETKIVKNFPSKTFLEEGIVEDWAVDIYLNKCDKYNLKEKYYISPMKNYSLSSNLCTLWNIASNNQLRKEFISGKQDLSDASEKTEVFRGKMLDLFDDIHYTLRANSVNPANLDAKKIAKEYADIIAFCENNTNFQNLTKEQIMLYQDTISFLKSGVPLGKTIKQLLTPSTESEKLQNVIAKELAKNFEASNNKNEPVNKQTKRPTKNPTF